MTDEERRRLLVYLTKAGRRHMEDPSGALPKQVYRDPVDERIAGYSGLVRPLAGLADRITRPGRAGTAQRMNREYLENIHKRRLAQAQAQGAQADVVVKQLQAAAASDDPKISGPAIKRLTAMQKAMSAGRNPNDLGLYSKLAQGMDSEGNTIEPKETAEASPETSPESPNRTGVSSAQQRRSGAGSNLARNAKIVNLQERLVDVRKRIAIREADPSAGGKSPAGRGMLRTPLQTLRSEEAALVQELAKLQQPLTSVGQAPLTNTPTSYNPNNP